MALYRHQFVLHTGDAIPANFVTNTLYSSGTDAEAYVSATTIFIDMFKAFGSIYSTLIAQNNHQVKVYDMADPEPRTPIYETLWNLTSAPSQPPMPSEVAICLSFQAAVESGVNQARRRGRIYLGPVHTSINDSSGRPSSSARTTIANAAEAALEDFAALDPALQWVVYSQMNNSSSPVENGWIDNDFDTQRRRQQPVTARTIWP